ncbi:MAG: MBL fold metallo-hydrolase [Bryobacteraceae bacterium]
MSQPGGIRLTVLGSGTSVGVPTIGCDCDVCSSTDPRDNRLRPSVWLEFNGRSVVIDTTPDFRYQALRARISRVDSILFTHSHADHILGLDDLRPFNFRQKGPIPIYGAAEHLDIIRNCFFYIFSDKPTESSKPKIESRVLDGPAFDLHGVECQPILLHHGSGRVFGYRIGKLAYLTDHSEIPPESMEMLHGLDVLFLDALRHKPHPTHSTVERSLKIAEELAPARTFFTHLGHDLPHERTEQLLPPHVRLAYDGMQIEAAL